MLRFKDISIRNKLILMQVFTSVLVLIVFFLVFIITDIRSYRERKANDMISLAHIIGTNSVSTIQFDDQDAARKILSDLHNVAPQVVYAAITDKNGRYFATYQLSNQEKFSIPEILNESNSHFESKRLYVSDQIKNGDEVIGKVFLAVELVELEEIKQTKIEVAAFLLLVALVFAFVVALLMQSYISKRLLNLVSTMKKVSVTGDYNRMLTDDGKDEISTLIRVFNDLMQQVKENHQRKDDFIGIASHELKTPLTTVKGYMQLLYNNNDSSMNKQFVEKAMKSVNKLEKLITDLLDVSKIQGGQLELNMKEFKMDELLDETIASVQVVSPKHKIIKESDFCDRVVMADMQRIEQVIINLLSNAIKYSPGESKVLVTCAETNNELLLKIRDFGIGIPEAEQPYIFERFYRTRDTAVHISGFGLGLYICRDIINRHNGRLWVQQEEKGSSFCFSLPI